MRAILYSEDEKGKRIFHIRLEATSRKMSNDPKDAFIIFTEEVAKLEKLGYKQLWLTNQRQDKERIAFHNGQRVKNIR